MLNKEVNNKNLLQKINHLQAKLKIAEETINVLRLKKADAIFGLEDNLKKVFLIHDAIEPYRVMLESMNEGAVSVLTDGTIIYLNVKFAEMLSINHKNAAGKNITDYLAVSQRSEFKEKLSKSLKRTFTEEFIIKRRLKKEIPVNISFHNLNATGTKAKALMLVVTDLTEIKKANESITKNESKFRNLLNNSRDCIYEFSITENMYKYLSPSCKDIFGLPAEHLIGKDSNEMAKFISKESIKSFQDHLKKINKNSKKRKAAFYLEYEICNIEGDKRWLSNRHTVFYNKNGKAENLIGAISDITFRKVAQDELQGAYELQQKYLEQLTAIQDSIPANIALLDHNGNIIAVNKSWRVFGSKNGLVCNTDCIGMNYLKICNKATGNDYIYAKESVKGIKDVLSGKSKEFNQEYPCHSPNEKRWFRLTVSPISSKTNSGAVVMHLDITAQKLAELNLIQSEDQYKLLFYNNPLPMWLFNFRNLKFISVNDAAIKHYGYSKEEFLKMKLTDIRPRKEVSKYLKHNKEVVSGKKQYKSYNAGVWKHLKKNGEIIDVEITRTPVTFEGDEAVLILAHDISERLRAESTLIKRNREISELYRAGKELSKTLEPYKIYNSIYSIIRKIMPCDSMVISGYDNISNKITCMAAWIGRKRLDVSNFPSVPVDPSGKGIQSRVIKSEKSELLLDFQKAVSQTRNKFYYRPDGTIENKPNEKNLSERSAIVAPLKLKNKVIGVLQVKSLKGNAYTENDVKIVESLAAQTAISVSNADLYQQAQKEIKVRKETESELYKRTNEITLLYEAQQVLTQNIELNSIYDNSYKIVSNIMPIDCMIISAFSKDDNMIMVRYVCTGGTKQSVKEIPPIPLAPEGYGIQSEVIRTGKSTLTHDYNSYFQRSINKYSFTDNIAEKETKSLYNSAMIVPLKIDGEVIGTIQVLSIKGNLYDKNNLKLLESLSTSIAAAKANAKLFLKAQHEIEERKKKEEELQNIRKNLEEAQRIAHIGSWVYDKKTNKILNSKEVFRILGVKPINEGIEFENAMGYIYEEDKDKTINVIRNAMLNKSSYVNEDRVKRPDGKIRYVKVMGEPVLDKDGFVVGMHGTIQDITDIKRINDELIKSLSDKELLLKEIHHRVKNNLQIVSSLLRLQAEKIQDDTVLEHFKISEQRIKSMALIHQQLYRAKDFSNIDFKEYLIELCYYLLAANDTENGRIKFNIEAEELYFGIDTALPCGLIINELFTNAVKHAFPDGRKGNILLKLYKDDLDICYIEINDDGVGTANLDLKNSTSLGMELVNTLTDQLEGELSIIVNNGTQFKLSFRELAKKNN